MQNGPQPNTANLVEAKDQSAQKTMPNHSVQENSRNARKTHPGHKIENRKTQSKKKKQKETVEHILARTNGAGSNTTDAIQKCFSITFSQKPQKFSLAVP